MRRIVGSISLLVLLLNTLGTPLTYAEEYSAEVVVESNNDIQTDEVVEQKDGDEQSPEFPVNENFDDKQGAEVDPVEPKDSVAEEPVILPNIDDGSGGIVGESTIISDDDTIGSGGNEGEENIESLSGGNQGIGNQSGANVSEQTDFSGGNTDVTGSGGFSNDNSEDTTDSSGIFSSVTTALQDFLSTIRFFFVSDDNDYIKESKINGVKIITLEDPENGETITIMDRNLGAEDNDIQSEDSYGYYYQWGNNNGFDDVNTSNVTSFLATYTGKYEGIGYTRDNKFRVGSNDIWETDEEGRSNYDELWYLGEDEEVQGPCPEGYHIPSIEEWNKLVSVWTKIHTQDEQDEVKVTRSTSSDTIEESLERCGTGDFENQENCLIKEELPGIANLFMNELKLPRAGWYNNGEKEDSLGVYWTRTPGDLSYQSEVFSIEKFFGVTVNESDYKNRSNANSLRCFRNTKTSSNLFSSLSFGDDTLSLYDVESFTVTFDANRGTFKNLPTPNPQTVTSGSLITNLPSADPELPGYDFDGWFTATGDNGRLWNLANDVVTGNITLYAHWTYNLTYGELDTYMIKKDETLVKYVMMDRNLGATDVYNKDFGNENFDSFGYAYQWGNNYGFPRIDGNGHTYPWSDIRNTKVLSSDWQNKMPSKYASSTWVKGNNPWTDDGSLSKDLWGSVTDSLQNNPEVRQGPCPDGYHLPMDKEIGDGNGILNVWADVYNKSIKTVGGSNGFSFASADQEIFTNQFLWPVAGTHKKGDNMEYEQRLCAEYFASTAPADDKSRNIWFCKDDSGNKNYNKAIRLLNTSDRHNGSSVRCFKNSTDSANLAIHPDKGTQGLISVHKLGNDIIINEIKEPVRIQAGVGNLIFDGWYTDPDFAEETYKTGGSILSAQDTDLYAKWSCPQNYEYNGLTCLVSYNITFHANGGTIDVGGESKITTTESLIYGDTYDYSVLPIPTRPGYIFKGWYANFNGVGDYVDYGTDLKFNDKISIHLSAYMDNWSEFANGNSGKRIISCLNGVSTAEGWAIKGKDKTKIQFACVDTDWKSATSNKLWSSLASGWHDFDVIFDGKNVRLFLDGSSTALATSSNYTSGKLKYNSTNSILLGAQPGNSNTPYSDDPSYFHGKIKDVIIQNSDQRITSTGVLLVPNQAVTYYALWEEGDGNYNVDVTIDPVVGGNVTGTGTYNVGDSITLTAIPAEGYQFTGWYDESNNIISHDNPYIFTADASDGTGLKALFELKEYTVTVASNDISKGTIGVTQRPYTHGKRIEFSPNYDSGEYKFLKWELNGEDVMTGGDKHRTGNLVIEHLTGDLTVTGYFSTYDSCTFNGDPVLHGESVTGYENSSVPYGQSCVSQIRTCNDGTLSGSYQYASCEHEAPTACDLPWGGTLPDGESVTGYASASEICPDQCVGQRATCINGEWNISDFATNYTKSNCTTKGVDTDEFPLSSCPEHGNCYYKTGYTVSNNACVKGDVKYKLTSCEAGYHTEDWLTCTGNTKFVPCSHNDQIPEHSTEKVVDVAVNWNGSSWNEPAKCAWECDTHYHQSGSQCDIDTFDITWNYVTETGAQSVKESYGYGIMPSRVGSNYQTEQTGYTFNGWSPEPTEVIGDAIYTATYTEETNRYTILWKDWNGTVLFTGDNIPYGTNIFSQKPNDPSRGSSVQTGYTFMGWYDEKGVKLTNDKILTGNISYTAKYDEETRSYNVTWNYVTETGSQSVIQSYLYGDTPSRAGNNYQTDATGYTFVGWTPNIVSVVGDAIYTASYSEEPRSYNVTWNYKTETGSQSVTQSYLYGEIPSRVGNNYQTDATGYTFNSWTPEILPVTGNTEYTAIYTETPRSYNITWNYQTEAGVQSVVESYLYGETPSRAGNNYQTDATGYTFNSWTPEILPVTGNSEYTAIYTETLRSYNITWNYETETGFQSVTQSYLYGDTPSRVGNDYETVATGFTFVSWTPIPTAVTGNATYTALYNATTKEYSITWVDGDGKTLKTEQVAYGVTPSYSGDTPTKSETDQYTYSFNNTWSPAVVPVTGPATYTAQFDSTVRTYKIMFVDGDNNIIQSGYVAYGAIPVYEGETPTKTSTPKYTYSFSGSWSPAISAVTGEAIYTAQFTETINKYEIIWLDGDGEEVKREQVEYDKTPVYEGETPTKTRTDKYTYTFNDTWSPVIVSVTGPAIYTAQFDSSVNKYRITFVDGDGRIIQSGDVAYDETPVYTGSIPTKTSTPKYTYSFSGSWSPAISAVTGDATYVAEFTGTINKYEITWIDGDGNILKTEQVSYDEVPEYTGSLPTKSKTIQYTYTFNNTWSPIVEAVTGDMSYTAQFNAELNEYTITFHSNGGSSVLSQVKQYGTTADEPVDPIRDGYGFSGWYSDSGFVQKYNFESTIGGDVDLYAKWTPVVYSISYELNGGNLTGGVINPDTYTIESDAITINNPERVGYTFLGWTGSNSVSNPETIVSIASGSTGDKSYYANWQANIVDVTIRHYLQDLNPATNEVLTTYSLSGDTYSGELADSTITLSNYALNIDGYTYHHGEVNDIETITTNVLPNGSRVINLFYTRNSYNYVLNTSLGSVTTGSAPTGTYYYGAEVLLSGDTGNDCFMWSGWNIEGTILENNMKKTSFIMPANDVTVASSVTEKSYNIVFVGNGSTSGEMATLTGVMCREEIDLPLNTFKRAGYTFSGWSTTIDGEKKYEDGESVHTLTTGNNVTVDLYALWDINHYQVQWQNYDGYVLDEQTLAYNEMPEYKGGVTPTREADAQFTYSFTGWTPEYTRVEGDQVYTAVYSTTVNKYVVTWDVAGSGTTEEYEYGATPSYKGVPHKDPTKQYTYTFAGWSPTISTVTTGVTYTAIFTPVLRKYTVTWLNSNGDVLEVDTGVAYGTEPTYNGKIPTKPSDAQHTYIFAGWAPEAGPIEGDTTYHATFSTDTNEYTITWTNEDGTVLETDENVPYGTTPTYNGATPTKQSDAQYDYTFAGWTPTVHAVTKNQIYQATYTETLRKYTITWKNSNGDTLEVDTNVEYGTTPSYDGSTPISGGDAQYSYVFDTWSPAVQSVHGDATYTAKYKQNINTYKVTWKNRDGTVLEVVNGVEYGATPTHGDINPIRTGNEQYSYSFAGWTPAISAVHGDVEYTAQFTENLNIYNVTFVNDDLSTLKEALPYPYGTSRAEIVKPDAPTKQENEQYSYEFLGWTPVITIVTGHVTFMATYKTTLRKYTVIWKNYDGTVLETDENIPYGTTPVYNGATPTKPSTSQYAYRFVGWSPVVSEVHGNITYTAQFEPEMNTYTVTWKNRDGTVLETDEDISYGTRPIYDGDDPVKTGDVQYTYVFTGWNPDVDIVTSDITYVAKFDSVVNKYNVTWKNRDNTILEVDEEVPYGVEPYYDGKTPVRNGNAQFSYVFTGWSPKIDVVYGNMVYKAQYDEVINKYTVVFENYDGTVLQSDELDYGSIPEYTGEIPEKPGDAQYSFIFSGWNAEIMQVYEDTVYIAEFNSKINKYTVKFIDGDGNILQSGDLAYGVMPEYTGAEPTKAADAQYTYVFNTWSPAISEVTGDVTYEAQFSSTVNEYTITWVDGDGNTLKTEQIAYGQTPVYQGSTPTKTRTPQYTYSFNGAWSPEIVSVVGNATYEAQFSSIVNEYTITWVDGDGNTLKTEQVAYGQTPVYTGATPTKTRTPQYTYSFNGAWSPEIVSVVDNVTYEAQFSSTVNKYTITWKDGDGNILKTGEVAYNGTPVYDGVTPTKAATAQYTYTFNNTWSPEIVPVIGNATYIAQFDSEVNKYTITWKDGNDELLYLEQVAYGQTPVYTGATPTKTATAQYTYIFNNTWSPEIVSVVANATYKAQFSSKVNEYTITWVDGDGNTLKTEQVAYGQTPVYTGATPTKTATAQYTYTFNNTWSPIIVSVVGDAIYTAQFTENVIKYAIRFINYDDSLIIEKQVAYGTTSGNYKPTDPVREGYTFSGWIPELETVTGPSTYKAIFTINQYTVTPEAGKGVERVEGGGTYDYGTEIVLTGYAKEGYHFEGGVTVKEFIVIVGPNSVIARINAIGNTYKVRFQSGGGEGTMDDQEFSYGLTGTLKANSFSRNGYVFTGWNDEVGNVYADKGEIYNLATGGIVLFTALWKTGVIPPEPPTPISGGAAAGGGRIIAPVEEEHKSADIQTGTIVQTGDDVLGDDTQGETGYSTRTEEEMDAYKYAYKYHITTLAPREAAMPDDYVQRGHMAKMVVNYSLNVLHRKLPEEIPDYCKWNNTVDSFESQEIEEYAEKACALGIMGIDMNYFQPNKYVTRAQFGTIFGRLLRGKLPSTPYYAAHLAGLKERGIMTQIENPEDRIEIRKWAWLMFMRSEKYFKI